MILTIAIPTYNRNDILVENLKLLLPQLTTDCKLLIIDNHSDTPVEETVAPIISTLFKGEYKIARNRVNIGGNANILRCIEYCDTEYLWILGDDDPVDNSAVETVFSYIDNYSNVSFINFSSVDNTGSNYRQNTYITCGLLGFIDGIDSYGRVLLISAGVYRITETLKQSIAAGNLYQYSGAPHLVTLILSLKESSVCCFAKDSLISNCGTDSTPAALQGSPIVLALGITTILDIPVSKEIRDKLKEKIVEWISPKAVVRQLLLLAFYENKKSESRYYYWIIRKRLFKLSSSLRYKSMILLFDLMIIFPDIGFKIFAFFYQKIKGRNLGKDMIAGRTY